MKGKWIVLAVVVVLGVVAVCFMQNRGVYIGGSAGLKAAVKARTGSLLMKREIIGSSSSRRHVLGNLIAKADAKMEAGDMFVSKDRFGRATTLYEEAGEIYSQILGDKGIIEEMENATARLDALRTLAIASGESNRLEEARRFELNSGGYARAHDFEAAVDELAKAEEVYSKLAKMEDSSTLEDAVAARTSMLTLQARVRSSRLGTPSRTYGSSRTRYNTKYATDGTSAAVSKGDAAAKAAEAAFEKREYAPAVALFAAASRNYEEALSIDSEAKQLLSLKLRVQNMERAVGTMFKHGARPVSMEKGRQALADASIEEREGNIKKASELLKTAEEQFGFAKSQAADFSRAFDAKQMWDKALASADKALLTRYNSDGLETAKRQVADGDGFLKTGKIDLAIKAYADARVALSNCVALASTRQNVERAKPFLEDLQRAIAQKDKFKAAGLLAKVSGLIPAHSAVSEARARVSALKWASAHEVDLGGGTTIAFVLVPAGQFVMGSDVGPVQSKPSHAVKITKPFYMAKYETTQAQWARVMGESDLARRVSGTYRGESKPVVSVKHYDCTSFVGKMNQLYTDYSFDLPTEAQWEYACRAGTRTPYYWGTLGSEGTKYEWAAGNSAKKVQIVGRKAANRWGLHDMLGNVEEWCKDVYLSTYYKNSPVADPPGPQTGYNRVVRGGNVYAAAPQASYYRQGVRNNYSTYQRGFRLVVNLASE